MSSQHAIPIGTGPSRWGEALLRVGAGLALSIFVYTALARWADDPRRITLLLLVITESLSVILVLASRRPCLRDWQPLTVFCTLGATFYFLALNLAPGTALIPEVAASGLQALGLCWQIYAKLSLGRSFGLLPADRGIITGGAYRWIRHPIYFGYFLAHLGFLTANFGAQNVLVLCALYLLQGMRIVREEKLLARNEAYRDYCRTVRYRLVPYVF